MKTKDNQFVVLLGADYAGKSSVMRALRTRPRWRCVSADPEFLPSQYRFLATLRSAFLRDVLLQQDCSYSPEFLLSGMQMSLVYLRDLALAARERGHAIVDSYHYKLLAKCTLKNIANDQVFASWRQFPQPDRVIFLRVPPALAWQRAERAGTLNGFEHRDIRPTREGFEAFQRDLEQTMLAELKGLRVDIVDADASLERVTASVAELLSREEG